MVHVVTKMKNKRGFLLAEETLKIIIAVISIGFLIYFLAALYYNNKNSKDLELAEASLEHLTESINSNLNEVEIYNPGGWIILSWPYKNENKIPNSCLNLGWQSCICIAENVNIFQRAAKLFSATKDQTEELLENSDEGVCLENTKILTVKGEAQKNGIVIEPPMKLNIDYTDKTIIKA
ncbi:hypothetical protein HYT24_01710 [Candidatus Pacearchaeota archaeon]|nr:hypothetical protein [Candidatus Pacearchaeota archaeon]